MSKHLTSYAKTGNPLLAWRAYEESRAAGEPIPDLVLQYFDRVATTLYAMMAIHNSAQEARRAPFPEYSRGFIDKMSKKYGVRPADPARSALRALEMDRRGRGSVFERDRTIAKLEQVAWFVAEEILMGSKPYLAMEIVAKMVRVGRATVQRAWKANPDMLTRVRRFREERS